MRPPELYPCCPFSLLSLLSPLLPPGLKLRTVFVPLSVCGITDKKSSQFFILVILVTQKKVLSTEEKQYIIPQMRQAYNRHFEGM